MNLLIFSMVSNYITGSVIMVLASPPRPPVDLDDVNTLTRKNILPISFKFYMRVDTPWGILLLKFDTLRWLEQLLSQPNDTGIPKIIQIVYIGVVPEAT